MGSSIVFPHGKLDLIISDLVEFVSVRSAPVVKDTALDRHRDYLFCECNYC